MVSRSTERALQYFCHGNMHLRSNVQSLRFVSSLIFIWRYLKKFTCNLALSILFASGCPLNNISNTKKSSSNVGCLMVRLFTLFWLPCERVTVQSREFSGDSGFVSAGHLNPHFQPTFNRNPVSPTLPWESGQD